MPSLAFTADSRQTEAGRLYNRSEEDETRIPLQKAIDDADYEHGHRVNELDFLTAFRSPVAVARKINCAFNTVRVSSTGRPWIVDNDSRGGDDEHAQPNAELATELTGQTRAERRTRFNLRTKTDIPPSALLCATFRTRRHLEDGCSSRHPPYSSTPTAGTLQQKHPRDPTAAGTCRPLLPPSRQSHAPRHCCLNRCSPTSTSSFVKLPIHNCAAGDPALEFMIKYATKQEPAQDAAFSK